MPGKGRRLGTSGSDALKEFDVGWSTPSHLRSVGFGSQSAGRGYLRRLGAVFTSTRHTSQP